ncbi:MAG: hypothetical protein JWO30_444 [Fibrobacteres bacterium]|nr:hypothetical protein [Fibrobacterota bacterium]
MSPAALMAIAMMLSVSIAGHSYGKGVMKSSLNPDTTSPGPGTGRSGQGKGPAPLDLGKSGDYVILAKSGISTTGVTAITGDIGVSPNKASAITGFDIIAPPSTYATSAVVTGKIYASDYDSPTPANLTTAVLDMMTAYTDAAGRAPDYIELGAGDIGGKTLAPAVYKWGTNVLIPADVTLSGGPNDVWIFEIAGNLSLASGVQVILKGGALPRNIFWQVAGATEHATTSHFEGVILSETAIILKTGATANGRLLAQTAVVLDANTLVKPAESDPTAIRSTRPVPSQAIRFVSIGDKLALFMGGSASARTVAVYDVNGMLRHMVFVPAGQTRTVISNRYSPDNGFLFQVK